jgi:hypothetical protein
MTPFDAGTYIVHKGICHALFGYDVGLSIDLAEADKRITATKERGTFRHKQRAPDYLEYRPAPLRVLQDAPPLTLGGYATASLVEVVLYDFGAVSVSYRIPLEGPLLGLLDLSEILYGNPELLADSRQRIEGLLSAIVPSIERPAIAGEVEDYLIFEFEDCGTEGGAVTGSGQDQFLAQILRCERSPLSDQEVRDATSNRISFGRDDTAVIDWNAALLFGRDMEDVLAVLEFANVELLEMRILDRQLDAALDQAYEALSKRRRPFRTRLRLPRSLEADSTRVARMQVDSAILFERVNNTLKLVGDQYLARVYRLVSQRFHLETWDGSITRKLHTLDSIYGKLTDRAAARRMEALEWIIIALIAVSIAVSFHP